jgi:hypothetical protein
MKKEEEPALNSSRGNPSGQVGLERSGGVGGKAGRAEKGSARQWADPEELADRVHSAHCESEPASPLWDHWPESRMLGRERTHAAGCAAKKKGRRPSPRVTVW